jgi:hypothetical protein
LVCSKSKQTNVDGRSREDAQSSNKSRFHSKFGKVKFNPNTDNNLHRSNVLFKRGNSSSCFRTNNQTSVRNRKYLKNRKSSYSKIFSSSISYCGFWNRTNTESKVVHATNSVTPSFSLETIKSNSGSKRSFFETFKKSSKMVVEPGKSKQVQVHNSIKHIDNSDNRRFQKRVRGSPKQKKETFQGIWSKKESLLHINVLEMEAAMLSIQHSLPKLVGKHFLIRLDNSTVVRNINKQEATHSPQLCMRTWKLWQLALDNQMLLKAAHIAGKKNILADRLSRFKVQPTEWTLNKKIVLNLFTIWEVPHIDLFASHQTDLLYPHS